MWRGRSLLACWRSVRVGRAALCLLGVTGALAADRDEEVVRQLRQLEEQNQPLLKQLGQQQTLIDGLARKVHPELKRVTFDRPGRIDAFCSIHTAIHCIVLVLENPYFATADGQGRYRIAEVPAGTYRIKAWHERLPSQIKEITVPASGTVQADFVLCAILNRSHARGPTHFMCSLW